MATNSLSASPETKTPEAPEPEQQNCKEADHPDVSPSLPPSKQQPKRIIRRRRAHSRETAYQIDPLLLQKVLDASSLPLQAYQFEIVKTVQRCVALEARHIALQLPEGLLLYATVLADVFKQLSPCLEQVSVLGDVTYGACCVDDITAQQLGCQLLVHYGHSCLVPLQHTVVPVLYVFVEIQISVPHLVDCFMATLEQEPFHQSNSSNSQENDEIHTIYLLGTVQFRHALATARDMLLEKQEHGAHQKYHIELPQVKPLSPGEVLGCTSPVLPYPEHSIVCFVADGRFHLESTLIANPHVARFFRYDPYSRTMTEESYDHIQMHQLRQDAIQRARNAHSQVFGVILGTLGRQGNPAIVQRLRKALRAAGKRHFVLLLSEITPAKLQLMEDTVDVWVQVACPRLSVDWGHYMSPNGKPVLNPYECMVCLDETEYRESYPMDYYSQAGGPWSNYHGDNRNRQLVLDSGAEENK